MSSDGTSQPECTIQDCDEPATRELHFDEFEHEFFEYPPSWKAYCGGHDPDIEHNDERTLESTADTGGDDR